MGSSSDGWQYGVLGLRDWTATAERPSADTRSGDTNTQAGRPTISDVHAVPCDGATAQVSAVPRSARTFPARQFVRADDILGCLTRTHVDLGSEHMRKPLKHLAGVRLAETVSAGAVMVRWRSDLRAEESRLIRLWRGHREIGRTTRWRCR
ncbi:hypothetical protein GCM10022233_37140 [Streptomyces shaanxiensis]|uniref:Uncharacterized protein n=1 Tax=Streptomyces shaanxiensis TaxID=653357 RepID=A0ABP7V6D3_9ACTN